jgi:hypothetical protein
MTWRALSISPCLEAAGEHVAGGCIGGHHENRAHFGRHLSHLHIHLTRLRLLEVDGEPEGGPLAWRRCEPQPGPRNLRNRTIRNVLYIAGNESHWRVKCGDSNGVRFQGSTQVEFS